MYAFKKKKQKSKDTNGRHLSISTSMYSVSTTGFYGALQSERRFNKRFSTSM